jgi:segregation and condensation protein B
MAESPTMPPEGRCEDDFAALVNEDRTEESATPAVLSLAESPATLDDDAAPSAAGGPPLTGPVAVPLITPPALTLAACCEALLFIAAAPLSVDELAKATEATIDEIATALDELALTLRAGGRGLRLQSHGERHALTSAPPAARAVARLLGLSRIERLSAAALETLAIVAYRGPVTRGEIEAIRGVDSSGVVQTLVARELIEALGRRKGVGQPIEYAVTAGFLRHFGLASLNDLPPLGEVNGQAVEETWDERLRGAREITPAPSEPSAS